MAEAFCSTIAASFSVVAPPCSIAAAIPVIVDAVTPAAAASSTALQEIYLTDAVIYVNFADVCSIAVVTLSASRATLRIDDDISLIAVATSSAAVAMSRALDDTL